LRRPLLPGVCNHQPSNRHQELSTVYASLLDLFEQSCVAIPLKLSLVRLLTRCTRALAVTSSSQSLFSLPLSKFHGEIATLSRVSSSDSQSTTPVYLQALLEFLAVWRASFGEDCYENQLKAANIEPPGVCSFEYSFYLATALLDCLSSSDYSASPLPKGFLSVLEHQVMWMAARVELVPLLLAEHNSNVWNRQSDVMVAVLCLFTFLICSSLKPILICFYLFVANRNSQ
jgi:hypothetical protein